MFVSAGSLSSVRVFFYEEGNMQIDDYDDLIAKIEKKMRSMIHSGKIKIWDKFNYARGCDNFQQEILVQYLMLSDMPKHKAIENAIKKANQAMRPKQCRKEHILELPISGRPLFANAGDRFDAFEYFNDRILGMHPDNPEKAIVRAILDAVERTLTGRHLEIFQRMRIGMKQKDIARELGLAEGTVWRYVHNSRKQIQGKLDFGEVYSIGRE